MTFTKMSIPDIVLIEPKVHGDERGYFFESFRVDKLEEFLGYTINFVQDNESKSSYGVLRGLHYQKAPYAQMKIVRVIEGAVIDVAVDIRRGSPTFGKHVAVELSSQNKRQLLIPSGFAHGFAVLSQSAVFAYKVDNYYSSEHERGVAFDDKDLGIEWHIVAKDICVSLKDRNLPRLKDADISFEYQSMQKELLSEIFKNA